MARPCSVCTHDRADDLDAALALGASMRALAASYGLSARALARHLDAGHGPGRPITPRRLEHSNPQKADSAAAVGPVQPPKRPGAELEPDNAAVDRPTEPPKSPPDLVGAELEPDNAAPVRPVEPLKGPDDPAGDELEPDNAAVDYPTRPPKRPLAPAGDELGAATAPSERLEAPLRTDYPTEAPAAPQTENDRPLRAAAAGAERLVAADVPPVLDLSDPATQRAILAALSGRRDPVWLEAEAEYLREQRGQPGPPWSRRPW